MRKGSGTFFVYRRFAVAECNEAMKAPVGLSSDRTVLRSKMEGPRPDKFCGESTQSSKRAKAGYHHSGGALPFALRNQVRFVRTWSSPYMALLGVIAAYVRTERACTPLARCNTLDFVPKSVC